MWDSKAAWWVLIRSASQRLPASFSSISASPSSMSWRRQKPHSRADIGYWVRSFTALTQRTGSSELELFFSHQEIDHDDSRCNQRLRPDRPQYAARLL